MLLMIYFVKLWLLHKLVGLLDATSWDSVCVFSCSRQLDSIQIAGFDFDVFWQRIVTRPQLNVDFLMRECVRGSLNWLILAHNGCEVGFCQMQIHQDREWRERTNYHRKKKQKENKNHKPNMEFILRPQSTGDVYFRGAEQVEKGSRQSKTRRKTVELCVFPDYVISHSIYVWASGFFVLFTFSFHSSQE